MNIQEAEITIENVGAVGEEQFQEDGSRWLDAKVCIGWNTGYAGGSGHATIKVGCWSDIDDDHAEWCAANEGARALRALVGAPDELDTRGGFFRCAMPIECDDIGRDICRNIREKWSEEKNE